MPGTSSSIAQFIITTAKCTSTVTKTVTVKIASSVPSATPSWSGSEHISWRTEKNSTAQETNDLVVAFQALMTAHALGRGGHKQADAKSATNATEIAGETSTNGADNSSSASRVAMDLPGGNIIFLNTTSPNYVMFDYASANLLIWTVPNATVTQDSQFRKLVDNISTWLPLIEALGLLAVIWEIGKFAYGRVQMRRTKGAFGRNGSKSAIIDVSCVVFVSFDPKCV